MGKLIWQCGKFASSDFRVLPFYKKKEKEKKTVIDGLSFMSSYFLHNNKIFKDWVLPPILNQSIFLVIPGLGLVSLIIIS